MGCAIRTNDERRTTNDERRTTNDERRTTKLEPGESIEYIGTSSHSSAHGVAQSI